MGAGTCRGISLDLSTSEPGGETPGFCVKCRLIEEIRRKTFSYIIRSAGSGWADDNVAITVLLPANKHMLLRQKARPAEALK